MCELSRRTSIEILLKLVLFTDGAEEVLLFPPIQENYTEPRIVFGPKNITAFLGDRVELQCRVSGHPQPKIQWISKREGKLSNIGPNFRVHKNNSLIFRRVEKRDESYYHCEAQNIEGNVKSPQARLTVEGRV